MIQVRLNPDESPHFKPILRNDKCTKYLTKYSNLLLCKYVNTVLAAKWGLVEADRDRHLFVTHDCYGLSYVSIPSDSYPTR